MCVVKYGNACVVARFADLFLLGGASTVPVGAVAMSEVAGVMMRSSTESSSWKRCRLFTIRREKSRVPN